MNQKWFVPFLIVLLLSFAISVNNGIVKFLANGYNQRVIWKHSETIINQGSSFACAHMMANIVNVNITEQNYDLSFKKQLTVLNKHSKTVVDIKFKEKIIFA